MGENRIEKFKKSVLKQLSDDPRYSNTFRDWASDAADLDSIAKVSAELEDTDLEPELQVEIIYALALTRYKAALSARFKSKAWYQRAWLRYGAAVRVLFGF